MTIESGFNEDFLDILRAFDDADVEFLVVGAHAMALHGVPRATGDLDLFVRATQENARLIKNKRATARDKDLVDVRLLTETK